MMTDGSQSGARLVPRRVLSSVQRELARLAALAAQRLRARSSRRWQSLSAAGNVALREAARRWPQLATLLGLAGAGDDGRTTRSAAPSQKSVPAEPSQELGSAEVRAASLAVLRSSADFAERAGAVDALGRLVDEETTAALVTALRDSASEVAVRAAEALQLHRSPLAVSALRDVLANEDRYFRPETRAAAVRALGVILPLGDGASLCVAVADDDATVSLAAIAALAERDEARGADALVGVIERADGFYLSMTRYAAARALSKMHGLDPTRLRRLVEHEADPEVRTVLQSIASAS
jgi:HEAT repeat protein